MQAPFPMAEQWRLLPVLHVEKKGQQRPAYVPDYLPAIGGPANNRRSTSVAEFLGHTAACGNAIDKIDSPSACIGSLFAIGADLRTGCNFRRGCQGRLTTNRKPSSPAGLKL